MRVTKLPEGQNNLRSPQVGHIVFGQENDLVEPNNTWMIASAKLMHLMQMRPKGNLKARVPWAVETKENTHKNRRRKMPQNQAHKIGEKGPD